MNDFDTLIDKIKLRIAALADMPVQRRDRHAHVLSNGAYGKGAFLLLVRETVHDENTAKCARVISFDTG